MSLSDCVKCWSTPCECGHGYRNWTPGRLLSLINTLDSVLAEQNVEQYRIRMLVMPIYSDGTPLSSEGWTNHEFDIRDIGSSAAIGEAITSTMADVRRHFDIPAGSNPHIVIAFKDKD